MRATPLLAAALIAAGCSFAFAQTGGGGTGGGGAGTGGAGAAAGADSGGGSGAAAGASGASAGTTGAGTDTRVRRSGLTERFRRGDDMAPLVIPQDEYVYMRRGPRY